MASRRDPARASSSPAVYGLELAAALVLSAVFVAISYGTIDELTWEYDEGTFMVQARRLTQGQRPFIDFVHHQPPLHLYLLALSGMLFGPTVFGFRMLSLLSISGSGLLLFLLARPFVGPLPALVAQAAFLFSPSQAHALGAVAETPMLFFVLLGALLLLIGTGRSTAWLSGVAFVVALLVRPTCMPMVLAAVLSLVYARAWQRLRDLTVSGIIAAAIGLIWVVVQSEGVFADILRFQLERLGMRNVDAFQVLQAETGLGVVAELRGIHTGRQWALFSFRQFWLWPKGHLGLFFVGCIGSWMWVTRYARSHRALQAFSLLWPALYLLFNFVILDFVTIKYFIPFLAFWSFLLAGLVALVQRWLPSVVAIGAVGLVCAGLAVHFSRTLPLHRDVSYFQRAEWIARHHSTVVSFSPMLFAATGTEPGCGFANPALTYGSIGASMLAASEHTRSFWFSDERLLACLRVNPEARVVIDPWLAFFTKPGPLREYLGSEGKAQRLFLSEGETERYERMFESQ
jgi:4-amino-4-deoxy-L-arabinose transferase-like glycosyltransferase